MLVSSTRRKLADSAFRVFFVPCAAFDHPTVGRPMSLANNHRGNRFLIGFGVVLGTAVALWAIAQLVP
jgi:hypothetical protein